MRAYKLNFNMNSCHIITTQNIFINLDTPLLYQLLVAVDEKRTS